MSVNKVESKAPSNYSCSIKPKPLWVAIGAILVVGSIFLILAANRVLPAGVNPISQLGKPLMWATPIPIGVLLIVFGMIASKPSPNAPYRIAKMPYLTFTKEQTEAALNRLKNDLKNTIIEAEGCPPISAYDLLNTMSSQFHGNSDFLNLDTFHETLQSGLCAGLTEMHLQQNNCSIETRLQNAQANIDTILYEQIKDDLSTLLNCYSQKMTLALNVQLMKKATILLKKQAVACLQQLFGMSHQETFLPKERASIGIPFQDFNNSFSKIKGAVTGRVTLRAPNTKGINIGHTFWFQYKEGAFYIMDSMDLDQGLFRFPNQEAFIKGLYDQIHLKPGQFVTFQIQKMRPIA